MGSSRLVMSRYPVAEAARFFAATLLPPELGIRQSDSCKPNSVAVRVVTMLTSAPVLSKKRLLMPLKLTVTADARAGRWVDCTLSAPSQTVCTTPVIGHI
jgi:hypothetical protein